MNHLNPQVPLQKIIIPEGAFSNDQMGVIQKMIEAVNGLEEENREIKGLLYTMGAIGGAITGSIMNGMHEASSEESSRASILFCAFKGLLTGGALGGATGGITVKIYEYFTKRR